MRNGRVQHSEGGAPLKALSVGTDILVAVSEAAVIFTQIINSFPRHLRPSGSKDFTEADDIQRDSFYRLKNEARFVEPRKGYAKWLIRNRDRVLRYDLKTDQIRFVNREIFEAPRFSELAFAKDGRTIINPDDLQKLVKPETILRYTKP